MHEALSACACPYQWCHSGARAHLIRTLAQAMCRLQKRRRVAQGECVTTDNEVGHTKLRARRQYSRFLHDVPL